MRREVLKNLHSIQLVLLRRYKRRFFTWIVYAYKPQKSYSSGICRMFETLASTLNMEIVIPATTHTYEPVSIAPQARKSKKG